MPKPANEPATFICPKCGREYGDPLYHGPDGHAPPTLCFDCWAGEWGAMAARLAAEYATGADLRWRARDLALFWLCQGHTQGRAAELAGVTRRALVKWLRAMRQGRMPVPQWLKEWREAGGN